MSACRPRWPGCCAPQATTVCMYMNLAWVASPTSRSWPWQTGRTGSLSPADTDFGELLANAPVLAPSVILLRRADRRAGSLAAVVLANLGQVTEDPAAGALIVISETASVRDDSP
jgi:hypothetical protein